MKGGETATRGGGGRGTGILCVGDGEAFQQPTERKNRGASVARERKHLEEGESGKRIR